ncbi:MAG: enhanced serine sensitivity protein SseB C-terminal domain-containing protein, partial [Clostridia bacterium]|nr:enhanced serine sensitivity protein SseB C-terminal domain-containing protein [Clostridia bacterium]
MERDGEKSYLVIVDFDGDLNAAFKGIGDTAAPYLKNGMYLD